MALVHAILLAGMSAQGQSQGTAATNDSGNGPAARLPDVLVEGRAEEEGLLSSTNAVSATKSAMPLMETPQSVSVVTDWQMEAQGVDSLAEAFRYTAGVQSEVFGFEPRLTWIQIRGFDVSTSGLFRDGMQLRNPGFYASYNLEPFGAERIEIPKGPASVLYGGTSAGGIVNFVTKRPQPYSFFEVGATVASHEHYEGRVDFNAPLDEEGKFAVRLTGLYRDSDTQVDFIEEDRAYLAPAVSWRPREGTSLTLMGHYQDDETKSSQSLPAAGTLFDNPNGTVPVHRFLGEPSRDTYERDEHSLTVLFEHEQNEWLSFHQKSRYYETDLYQFTVYALSLEPDQRTMNRRAFEGDGEVSGLTFDNQVLMNFETGPLDQNVLAGVDYQDIGAEAVQGDGSAPSIDVFNPNYGSPVPQPPQFLNGEIEQSQLGVYLQDQLVYDERLFVTLGGRFDWAEHTTTDRNSGTTSDQDDEEFTGRAGVLYRTDWGVNPYASYSESFLPVPGMAPSGNPFEPEEGRQYEGGIKFQPEGYRSYFTASYFHLTRENFTEFDSATFQTVQTGEVRSQGIELDGMVALGMGVDLLANFTYLDAEITESVDNTSVGERPTQVPEYIASAWVNYALPASLLEGLSLQAGARFIGSTYGNTPNTLESEDAVVFDVGASYVWNNLSANLVVQNVFDKEHVTGTFQRGGTAFTTYGQTRDIALSLSYLW